MAIPLSTLHPYVYEFDASITHIADDGGVEFDTTYFYATGGGQPNDLGIVKRNDEVFTVVDVKKRDGHILHYFEQPGLETGDAIHGIIDKERREKLRRMHTATHVLCAVLERSEGAVITGNQIGTERTRVDFSLQSYDPARIPLYFEEANRVIAQNPPVEKFTTTRDELLQNPQLVKLAMGFPEDVKDVHMVRIGEYDLQPCGGTHVDSLSEIGTLVFERAESKGTKNRRISFTLTAP